MNQLAKRSTPIAGIVIVIAIFSVAYRLGLHTAPNPPAASLFRVHGLSMSPTFADADLCRIDRSSDSLQIGDVVAIDWQGTERIKRIAALGGNIVDQREGRLLIDGQRLEDILAQRHRNSFVPPGRVVVSLDQDHWQRDPSNPHWMIYTHRDPHQANRVAPVMDDYPMNTNVRRILNPTDRLVLQLHPVRHDNHFESDAGHETHRFPVAFYDPQRAVVMTLTEQGLACFWIAANSSIIDDSTFIPQLGLIDASHPVAIAIDENFANRYQFHVYRDIEYRDDKPSGSVDYPIILADDEVFVVGDNVPVSVDSRNFGPIKRSAVIGAVSRMNESTVNESPVAH